MAESTRGDKAHRNDSDHMPEKKRAVRPELRFIERLAIKLCRAANETAWGKRWQTRYMRSIGYSWIWRISAFRTLADGLDNVCQLMPNRGVLFVSNHRTFFDQYIMTIALFMGPT